jgi:hypothetical protein
LQWLGENQRDAGSGGDGDEDVSSRGSFSHEGRGIILVLRVRLRCGLLGEGGDGYQQRGGQGECLSGFGLDEGRLRRLITAMVLPPVGG